jgi:hypothetical protein
MHGERRLSYPVCRHGETLGTERVPPIGKPLDLQQIVTGLERGVVHGDHDPVLVSSPNPAARRLKCEIDHAPPMPPFPTEPRPRTEAHGFYPTR